ncbi:hypothetical protein SAY86_031511 [Trapa natans]|uniref:J domain-containing protein n=1 Tax=Trapa natans TaxID=22666 RepID=A0AAN7LM09_TRANT|nr:hypothetical protein SAY86_031511 [Trapa natans]
MNSSGFENMTSNFSFNSPSVPRSGLVFAKSRVSKRRSINRPNLKPENQAGPGANPFLHATEHSSAIGSSRPIDSSFDATYAGLGSNDTIGGMREGVIDEMRNLKIGSETKSVDANPSLNMKSGFGEQAGDHESSRFSYNEFVALKLQEDLRKLNIEGSDSRPVDKSYPDKSNANLNKESKLGQGNTGINVEHELPDYLKKLTIEDSGEIGSLKAENFASAPNLKVDSVNSTTKNYLGSMKGKNSSWSSHWSGVTEDALSNEVEKKLNLGNELKFSSTKADQPQFGFVASPAFTFTRGENDPIKAGTTFTGKSADIGMPFAEFMRAGSKVSLVSDVGKNIEFGAKRETIGMSKLKKKKKKVNFRQSAHVPLQPLRQEFVMGSSCFVEKPDASDSYSPMDVSPYQENVVDNRSSREASVTSSESICLDNSFVPTNSDVTLNDAAEEELVSATQHMKINCIEDLRELNEDASMTNPCNESVSAAESESFKTAIDDINSIRGDDVTSTEKIEASCSSNTRKEGSRGMMQYSFVSRSEETVGSNFTFSASSSSKGQASVLKHNSKKKPSTKGSYFSYSVEVPYASSPSSLSFSSASSSPLPSPQLESANHLPSQHSGKDSRINVGQEMKPKSPSTTSTASAAAQELCEKWRLKGNQAYNNGDMSKAEDYYTQGINCISKNEKSRNCLKALMLCYSNRAATLLSLGRLRDALRDCMKATEIDPNFFRVQVRAANCYLALGEIEDALYYYKKCLQAGNEVCADRRIAVEASEGMQKAQKVTDCINHCAELLVSKASQDAENALELIAEALTISMYSEKLIEMKVKILFMLQRYREVIHLCEQTLDSAKKNSLSVDTEESVEGSEYSERLQFRLWCCSFILKSHFHMGRLEEGLVSLEKQEEQLSTANSGGSSILESSIPLVRTVRELIRLKAAGNEAFQVGRHAEAIEHYTAALSYNIESRPFTAICFCNRAAAYKALGQITDAIADCSLAIALDGNYLKAISRRATLYEMIRDYDQAAADLQRLISVLTRQVEEKTGQSGGYDSSLSCVNELRRAQFHLSEIEEANKKDVPLDLYLILGVESVVSVLEIRKAYRKLALRHHPDKACQFFSKADIGDGKLPKGIAEEIQKDADRLFKMIGEAYAVLSDSVKRAKYDLEEETRIAMRRRNEASTYRTTRNEQYYPFERSNSVRHQQREAWGSRPRGSESSRWTQYKG